MAEPTAIVPNKGIRPGYNETGATISKNLFVAAVAGSATDSVALPAAGARVKGATMDQIPDEGRGNIQIDGMAIVTAGAAVARGANVAAAVTGRAVTAATGNVVAGVARSAAAADGDLIEVELSPLGFVAP